MIEHLIVSFLRNTELKFKFSYLVDFWAAALLCKPVRDFGHVHVLLADGVKISLDTVTPYIRYLVHHEFSVILNSG